MSQRKQPSKTTRPKPKRTRASSLQVYLSKQEIQTLREIAERRAVTSSELVRTWIAGHQKRYEGQIRAAMQAAKRKSRPPKPSKAPVSDVEPVDPRQLRIVGAE